MKINYWLMKSEPSVFSIDDLQKSGFTSWEGVRNYQARNFMRDMHCGDLVLFYHSNANPPGIAGICRICQEAHPDPTALDPKSDYFDPKASSENPIWIMVEVEYVEKFQNLISIKELRSTPGLENLEILKKGSRLSITPVTKKQFDIIREIGRLAAVETNSMAAT